MGVSSSSATTPPGGVLLGVQTGCIAKPSFKYPKPSEVSIDEIAWKTFDSTEHLRPRSSSASSCAEAERDLKLEEHKVSRLSYSIIRYNEHTKTWLSIQFTSTFRRLLSSSGVAFGVDTLNRNFSYVNAAHNAVELDTISTKATLGNLYPQAVFRPGLDQDSNCLELRRPVMVDAGEHHLPCVRNLIHQVEKFEASPALLFPYESPSLQCVSAGSTKDTCVSLELLHANRSELWKRYEKFLQAQLEGLLRIREEPTFAAAAPSGESVGSVDMEIRILRFMLENQKKWREVDFNSVQIYHLAHNETAAWLGCPIQSGFVLDLCDVPSWRKSAHCAATTKPQIICMKSNFSEYSATDYLESSSQVIIDSPHCPLLVQGKFDSLQNVYVDKARELPMSDFAAVNYVAEGKHHLVAQNRDGWHLDSNGRDEDNTGYVMVVSDDSNHVTEWLPVDVFPVVSRFFSDDICDFFQGFLLGASSKQSNRRSDAAATTSSVLSRKQMLQEKMYSFQMEFLNSEDHWIQSTGLVKNLEPGLLYADCSLSNRFFHRSKRVHLRAESTEPPSFSSSNHPLDVCPRRVFCKLSEAKYRSS